MRTASNRKLGGRSRLMRSALCYAKNHGWSVDFTSGGHLAFRKGSRCIFAPATPRSERASLQAICSMKRSRSSAHS